jgi:ParB/RepB/Spo0J family partition protein
MQDHFLRIPLELIDVKRDERQRREIRTDDLEISIKLRGVLQPIIVEPSAETSGRYVLIAGERRLQASRNINVPDIPARLAGELTDEERQVIELEENLRRRDLTWQEAVVSYSRIHTLYAKANPDGWTQTKTADAIGVSRQTLSDCILLSDEMKRENKVVVNAPTMSAALNATRRKNERAISDAMTELLYEEAPVPDHQELEYTTESLGQAIIDINKPVIVTNDRNSILNESFHDFAASYSGTPFNFLHCDFPYGIGHDKSDQGGSGAQWEGYEDSEDTYWRLCQTLCTNIDRLMAPSSHILFWLSSDIERQYETIRFFRSRASSLVLQTVPLVWHKSDNRGILPDPQRGPRRIVETALIGARGDRLIIRAVSNAYSSPTTKEIHQSEKPEPMLRHFFQMFVDEHTRMLDPTCGSGTSLRAAEGLGASSVLGLEINPDFAESARAKLRQTRTLRAYEKEKISAQG